MLFHIYTHKSLCIDIHKSRKNSVSSLVLIFLGLLLYATTNSIRLIIQVLSDTNTLHRVIKSISFHVSLLSTIK